MKKATILIILFLISTLSQAFKLTPMSYTIIGSEKVANFTVENDGNIPIAVQLEVKVRDMKSDGAEMLPETEDFLIFPDQLVLEPNKRRVVKVRWLKGEIKDFEKSFRLIAEQLPVELNRKKRKKTDIKILLRYVAALYVAPTEGKAKIKISSAKTTKDLKSIDLVVENVGQIHKILSRPEITIIQEGRDFKVKSYEGIIGENILAGSKRFFTVKPPSEVNIQKPYQVKISND